MNVSSEACIHNGSYMQCMTLCIILRYGFYVQYSDASYGYSCTLPGFLLGYLFGHVTGLCKLLALLLGGKQVGQHWWVSTVWCSTGLLFDVVWLFLGTMSVSYDTCIVLLCCSQHTPAPHHFDIQLLKGRCVVCVHKLL